MPPHVQNVIRVRASEPAVARSLSRLAYVVSGSPGGAGGLVRALQVRVGLALLQRIRDAFMTKAAGETDEAGDKWAPLSPHTKAYTRRHPKIAGQDKGAPKRREFWKTHPSYAVTQKQRAEWWAVYASMKARFGGNKRHAAAVAWIVLRKRYPGIKTLMDKYGDAKVEILRDSGVLLNSLSPGVPAATAPPSPPRRPHQIFRNLPGLLILGTNRKGAADNHKGIPGKLPQRRLWPPPIRWPHGWISAILSQARQGVVAIALYLIRGNS